MMEFIIRNQLESDSWLTSKKTVDEHIVFDIRLLVVQNLYLHTKPISNLVCNKCDGIKEFYKWEENCKIREILIASFRL